MNLLENKMIRKFIVIGLFPFALALLVTIILGILTFFNFDFLDTLHNAIYFLYPVAMIVMVFLGYRFLYDKRYFSLYNQTTFSEKQKVILPLVFILIPALIFDITNIIIQTSLIEDYNYFILIYFKYLIFSFTILYIVSSSSIIKTITLLLLSALAILVNFEMFENLTGNLVSLIIVLVLVIISLLISYIIYFYYKKTHNSEIIESFYFLQIFVIALVFFREIFVTNYPYYMYGYTIQFLSSNINITFYLIAFICIGVFVYLIEQRFVFKKIISLIGITIMISIIYIGISNTNLMNSNECNKQITQTRNIELYLNDNYLTSLSGIDNKRDMQTYLASQASKCFKNKTISAGLDHKSLNVNNQVVFVFNDIGYLIDKDKVDYNKILKILLDDNKIFLFWVDKEVGYYSNNELDKESLKELKSLVETYFTNYPKDNLKKISLSNKQISLLFETYFISMIDEDIYDDDYQISGEFAFVNRINLAESDMMTFSIANNPDFVKSFNELKEEANND